MKTNINSKKVAVISFLGALGAILMLFDFPLPIAPPFMKMDLSDIPIIIGGFLLGPYSVIATCIIKILIKLVLKGTSTFFIGEIANFVSSVAYSLSASIIYGMYKSKKSAVFGLVIGVILSSFIITMMNTLFLFPLYINVFNMSEESIISMCKSINPFIDSMMKVMLFSVFPFNIIKYTLSSIVTYIFYKHISNIVKNFLKNE